MSQPGNDDPENLKPEEPSGNSSPEGQNGVGGEDITLDEIIPVDIQTEVGQSFLEYAMSVIVSRALPDARDGLKPVHRRILWSMSETGLRPDRGHVKCATVVGDVIAKYHPHGDGAVYDALVRMGQNFSLLHPLVDPHGNFGSPGDRAAAYRYTECRLTNLAMAMLAGINEETVDFLSNFDGRHREPEVLPARFPNLLVNGSQGIAVGLATNIPPHNLGEVIDASIHLLENPEATYEDLHEIVKGPDFPTGGHILGHLNTQLAYKSGRGQIKLRAVGEINEDQSQIIFSELPYQTSVEAIEERVHDLVVKKQIQGIKDVRNESAKGEIKLVFDLNNNVQPSVVMNNLYKRTPLQTTFAVNMVALNQGVPLTMNLLQLLGAYNDHQKEVVRRRSEFRLEQNRARAHILEGLLKALDSIDEIINTIKSSQDRSSAREALRGEPFEFSEIQANHILDMPLGRLTRLGHSELTEELEERQKSIEELTAILSDEKKLVALIIEEMKEIKDAHAIPRQTQFIDDPGELYLEDLIEDEELVFMLSKTGYVKCVLAEDFRAQNRGGMGVTGSKLEETDYVDFLINTTAHSHLLFFTNTGRVYRIKAYEVPLMGRTARGRSIVNILEMEPEEKITAIIDTKGEDYEAHPYLFFATRKGKAKKTEFKKFEKVRRSGLRAINLAEGDELIQVLPINEETHICLVSRYGKLLRFSGTQIRSLGRATSGVQGMRFRGHNTDDGIVAAVEITPATQLLTITEKGYGKRTNFEAFNLKNRRGLGVTTFGIIEERGKLADAIGVRAGDEIIMIAQSGKLIRMPVSRISIQGRTAKGVRLMNLRGGDQLTSVALMDEYRSDIADDEGVEVAEKVDASEEAEEEENSENIEETTETPEAENPPKADGEQNGKA